MSSYVYYYHIMLLLYYRNRNVRRRRADVGKIGRFSERVLGNINIIVLLLI